MGDWPVSKGRKTLRGSQRVADQGIATEEGITPPGQARRIARWRAVVFAGSDGLSGRGDKSFPAEETARRLKLGSGAWSQGSCQGEFKSARHGNLGRRAKKTLPESRRALVPKTALTKSLSRKNVRARRKMDTGDLRLGSRARGSRPVG